jgi:hypothetical protein
MQLPPKSTGVEKRFELAARCAREPCFCPAGLQYRGHFPREESHTDEKKKKDAGRRAMGITEGQVSVRSRLEIRIAKPGPRRPRLHDSLDLSACGRSLLEP